MGIFPNFRGEKKQYLKPPPSYPLHTLNNFFFFHGSGCFDVGVEQTLETSFHSAARNAGGSNSQGSFEDLGGFHRMQKTTKKQGKDIGTVVVNKTYINHINVYKLYKIHVQL